ncbi:hypothetical protein JTE90_010286 [Oedothorax gibbosus]|uniref:Uncharacterized protein n=1 Tax=Oedothorax gibbosus TaxID=931172 RepID=A0AAV6V5D4_9ARAC|nr:hypothetical protein JTE90_010286 [Oedothorax gibbosus]
MTANNGNPGRGNSRRGTLGCSANHSPKEMWWHGTVDNGIYVLRSQSTSEVTRRLPQHKYKKPDYHLLIGFFENCPKSNVYSPHNGTHAPPQQWGANRWGSSKRKHPSSLLRCWGEDAERGLPGIGDLLLIGAMGWKWLLRGFID